MAASMASNVVKFKTGGMCRSWLQTLHRRYLQTTSCAFEVAGNWRQAKAWDSREVAPPMYTQEEAQQIVLDFFNNCDDITLNKLFYTNRQKFQFTKAEDITRRGTVSNRFKDVVDLVKNTRGLSMKNLTVAAQKIKKLEELEKTYVIVGLNPDLLWEEAKDMESVVAVDIFQNEIAWAQETRERQVVGVGHEMLLTRSNRTHAFKPSGFDHLTYPTQVARMIGCIPQSPVYLFSQAQAHGQVGGAHQAMLQSLVILMLNIRSKLGTDTLEDWQAINDVMTEAGTIPNIVHQMSLQTIANIYDILFNSEVLSTAWSFQHWKDKRKSPMIGLEMTDKIEHRLSRSVGKGQMTKCVLMADVFCQNLAKNPDNFPRLYS